MKTQKHQTVPELIQVMVRKLAEEYAPERIILFGSYAYGTPSPDSDIDLLIIKDTPEGLMKRMVTVRRILTDPKRTVALGAIVLTPQELSRQLAKGDQFIEDIIGRGKVLYAA